jgi:hypothetical protein
MKDPLVRGIVGGILLVVLAIAIVLFATWSPVPLGPRLPPKPESCPCPPSVRVVQGADTTAFRAKVRGLQHERTQLACALNVAWDELKRLEEEAERGDGNPDFLRQSRERYCKLRDRFVQAYDAAVLAEKLEHLLVEEK